MRRAALAALLLLGACQRASTPDANRLFDAATDQFRHGELAEARKLTMQGIDLTSSNPSSVDAWRFRLLSTEIHLVLREKDEARSILRESLPDGASFAPLRAKKQCLEGQLQIVEGQLGPAIGTLNAAERLAHEAGATDVFFDVLALRGQAEVRLGHWDDGRTSLSTLIDQAGHRADDYHLALGLINLGRAYVGLDRHDQALTYLKTAVDLTHVTMRIRSVALYNAGICYTRLGDFDRALTMQQQAAQASEPGPKVFFEQALGELGTTYLYKGELQQGTKYLERALGVAIGDPSMRRDAQLWANYLAWAYIQQGAWDDAERLSRQSRSLREPDSADVIYDTVNDAAIAQGRGRLNDAAKLYGSALAVRATDPFPIADAYVGLARLDLAKGRTAQAAAHFESALEVIERTQSTLIKTDYQLTYLTRGAGLYSEYIDTLVGQRQFDRALEIADSSRARVLGERQGVENRGRTPAREFQRVARQSGSTLILYSLGPKQSNAWAVTATGIEHASLPRASEIVPLVRDYQQMIVASSADPIASKGTPGDALYSMLVAPFARLLGPGAPVVIVPDAALSQLNFETLPVDGPRRHYWIEDVKMMVAPSLGILAAAPAPRAAAGPQQALVIGDPATPDDPHFPPLRYAAAEVSAVAAAFPNATVRRGASATPQAFRDAHPERFGFIHFTAHASANKESPLDSAVILSPDANGYKLYARDVAEGRLDAHLVTISACRTAGDRAYSGEGLVGFAWAFLRAGARRVLAGLWDVDDRSTSELMTQVYAGLARGDTPASAVRSAKLTLLAGGGVTAKPYYWGPFELIVATP